MTMAAGREDEFEYHMSYRENAQRQRDHELYPSARTSKLNSSLSEARAASADPDRRRLASQCIRRWRCAAPLTFALLRTVHTAIDECSVPSKPVLTASTILCHRLSSEADRDSALGACGSIASDTAARGG